jgi:hypothetical protein
VKKTATALVLRTDRLDGPRYAACRDEAGDLWLGRPLGEEDSWDVADAVAPYFKGTYEEEMERATGAAPVVIMAGTLSEMRKANK